MLIILAKACPLEGFRVLARCDQIVVSFRGMYVIFVPKHMEKC